MDHHQLATHVATQFKKYREKAGMTQAGVASKAGVTVETVARLERVVRGAASANPNPSLETLARLAHAVGVEPLALLREGIQIPKTDRLDKVLLHATQTVRNTLAVLGEALVADEQLTWGYHSGGAPHPGMTRTVGPLGIKRAKKQPKKR